MNKTDRRARLNDGFSLVELLLTLVLILCLAAASVFTFTAIYQTSNLDEGVDRFQSLIRFAQAEASTTGRKVRLQFVPATPAPEIAAELRDIKVTWEADLLNAPGVFQEYTNKAWSEEIVNELVGVEKVKPLEPGAPLNGLNPVDATGSMGVSSGAGTSLLPAANPMADSSETADSFLLEEEFPSITFYPDGSCDSAEIVLASKNADDDRRLAVRLGGLLGTVSTRTLHTADSEVLEESADLDSNYSAIDEEFSDSTEYSGYAP